MKTDYQIHLNFLAIAGDLPSFTVHRRPREEAQLRPDDECMSHSLPIDVADPDKRQVFWVRFSPVAGFDSHLVTPSANNDLTRSMLFHALRDAASRTLDGSQYAVPTKGFLDEVRFVMANHAEGQELLVVQPYFLRAISRFGFLVDFHFRLGADVPFSRRVQQLSLSLDHGFRRNLDYYLDRTDRVRAFLAQRKEVFASIRVLGGTAPIRLESDFCGVPAFRLRSRTYIFGNGRQSKSQFTGLRDHGPMKPLERTPKLLFVFRETDRPAARKLAMSLRGSGGRERFTFPGFKALFKTDLLIDSNPVVLPDFSQPSMAAALARVKQDTGLVVPVLVLPDGSEEPYLTHKATFVHAGVPSQVCTLPVIQDDNLLKWSIGNIALQVFCKAGGQPWKVQPTGEPSLIIGISQSHKIRRLDTSTMVDKYFAFSVLTDSSGLFQRIQVLGESDNEASYLEQLRSTLGQVLQESSQHFSRVVLHTSFKMRWKEMDAIQNTVAQAVGAIDPSKCRFAVVKVNHRHRFFGINRAVNSLVPYEATTVRLGPREYLVWFEGIFPDKTTVTKAFPGPTHLEFLRVSSDSAITDNELLQDLVNLSGANWRGFNAKSAPVSVFYCHLVADLVHDFHERGLPLPAVQDLRPWFL